MSTPFCINTEDDEILINAAGSRIRLRTKDRIDTEDELLDEDDALMFLKEIILPRVNIKDSEQLSGEASKLRIQAKSPYSIEWISACLAAESGKYKFIKNVLKQIFIPLSLPPEMENARETLDFIEKLIIQRQRGKNRLQMTEPAEGYKAPKAPDDKRIRPNENNQKFDEETEGLLSFRKFLASILEEKH